MHGGSIWVPSDKKARQQNVFNFWVKKFVSYTKSVWIWVEILSEIFDFLDSRELIK